MSKRIIKLFVSILIFIICFITIEKLFVTRSDLDSMKDFYQVEENTIDVCFLGPSTILAGVDSSRLYNEHGINAFNLCAANQTLLITKYYLKEMLKYQHPKVIFVDTYSITFDNSDEGVDLKTRIVWNYNSTKKSIEKFDSIKELTKNYKEALLYSYLPLITLKL